MVQNGFQVSSSAGTANMVKRKSTVRTAVLYAPIETIAAFQKPRCIYGRQSNVHKLSDASIRFNRLPLLVDAAANFCNPSESVELAVGSRPIHRVIGNLLRR